MDSSTLDLLRDLGPGNPEFEPMGGGTCSRVFRARWDDGRTLVVKIASPDTPSDQFPSEAEGLRTLAVPHGPRVPRVVEATASVLVLEDVGTGVPSVDFWERLAEGLATLHGIRGPAFGFHRTTWLGATPLDNSWTDDGWVFHGARRIRPLLARAFNLGLLGKEDVKRGERLCGRLRDRIPEAPPVLVHGDLWRGNVLADASGEPALVDPAVHYGWAEADLAMTALFGGFPPGFLRLCAEASGLERRWTERVPYYNLVHLLNHLVLFGASWSAPVREILDRE